MSILDRVHICELCTANWIIPCRGEYGPISVRWLHVHIISPISANRITISIMLLMFISNRSKAGVISWVLSNIPYLQFLNFHSNPHGSGLIGTWWGLLIVTNVLNTIILLRRLAIGLGTIFLGSVSCWYLDCSMKIYLKSGPNACSCYYDVQPLPLNKM